MSKKSFVALILAAGFVVSLVGAPAFAEETALPARLTAVAAPGCGGAGLDLASLAGSENAVCPATPPADGAAPELKAPPFFTKTCVCSCGFPCKTDADCGAGGRCSAGITCC